jgi:N-acetylglucosamine-6-sulfatase
MKRLLVFLSILATFLLPSAAMAQPNLIIIKTDDEPDISVIREHMTNTRNYFLDHGFVFPNYFGSSLCCPDRASTLTGQHVHNHGLFVNKFIHLHDTIAEKLNSLGYYNIIVGKYLNKCEVACQHPEPGWDSWTIQRDLGYYGPDLKYWRSHGGDADLVSVNGYTTDEIARFAVQDIRSAPADRPIFAYITPIAPHNPLTPAERHKGDPRCDGLPLFDPPSYNEADVSDKPWYVRNAGRVNTQDATSSGYNLKRYCRTLLGVDDLVGDVIDALRDTGRLDNSVVIFVGDNGMNMGQHRMIGKLTPYATEVPFAIYAPMYGTSGRTIDSYIQNIDVAPTFADLAGGNMPTADGVSFRNLLEGGNGNLGRSSILAESKAPSGNPPVGPWSSVRTTDGHYFYVEYQHNQEREFYDLWNDPWMLNNLVNPESGSLRKSASGYGNALAFVKSELHRLESE